MKLSEAKHAFVTGGASGIGLGIAEALAAKGVAVTLADVDGETLSAVVADRGGKFPGPFRSQVLDVRDREGWASAKAEAEAAFGPVDILVNNAGVAPSGTGFADMDPADFDRIMGINLVGVFNGVSAFAADLRARGKGHIVNTASFAGLFASMPGVAAYAVSKFGVVALSESLRAELAPVGVGVSVLCPSLVHTNLGINSAKIAGRFTGSAADFEMPASNVTPADVGAMVVRAIENDEAYVITHKGGWPALEGRMQAIKAACDLADQG